MAVLPVGGWCDMVLAVENKRTEQQWVTTFPLLLCRWPSMHNNATYIILKLTFYTRLPTKFRGLPSQICVYFTSKENIKHHVHAHKSNRDQSKKYGSVSKRDTNWLIP